MTLDLNNLKRLAMVVDIRLSHINDPAEWQSLESSVDDFRQAVTGDVVLELIRLAEKASEPMLTTDDVPIERRGKLCTVCGKIVPELEAEGHCAGHGGEK